MCPTTPTTGLSACRVVLVLYARTQGPTGWSWHTPGGPAPQPAPLRVQCGACGHVTPRGHRQRRRRGSAAAGRPGRWGGQWRPQRAHLRLLQLPDRDVSEQAAPAGGATRGMSCCHASVPSSVGGGGALDGMSDCCFRSPCLAGLSLHLYASRPRLLTTAGCRTAVVVGTCVPDLQPLQSVSTACVCTHVVGPDSAASAAP